MAMTTDTAALGMEACACRPEPRSRGTRAEAVSAFLPRGRRLGACAAPAVPSLSSLSVPFLPCLVPFLVGSVGVFLRSASRTRTPLAVVSAGADARIGTE
ncbi:hypothetical protein [Azospirillum argentinense]